MVSANAARNKRAAPRLGAFKVGTIGAEPVKDGRKLELEDRIADGSTELKPEILEGMNKSVREVEARYGTDTLGPYDDFEWGMISGKLSAIRWMLGDEWDLLDS